jgi:methyltransferase-like protein
MPEPVAQRLSKQSVLRRADRTAWQAFDGRVVVLDIPSRTMFGLNLTAAHVWQQLDGERDLDAIAHTIAAKHQLPHVRVSSDVIAFAEELLARGCVEGVPSPRRGRH